MHYEIFLKNLKQYGLSEEIPNISEANAAFLKNILTEKKIQHLLEIGTANGYSSLQFAQVIEKNNGDIDTIEFSQLAYEAAQDNIEALSMGHIIKQYFGDARDIIPLLEKNYDFIFIDGLKKASLDFFLLSWEKLQNGGVIVIDDVIKFRYKMENLYEYLEKHIIPYTLIQIDEDDGIMIIEKN